MTPLLLSLDAAAVLILAVLVAELSRLRRRPKPAPVPVEMAFEFRRPLEWGPVSISRERIDYMRDAILYSQLIAIADHRYSRWSEEDKKQWMREWVDHDDDYVLSITGRRAA